MKRVQKECQKRLAEKERQRKEIKETLEDVRSDLKECRKALFDRVSEVTRTVQPRKPS